MTTEFSEQINMSEQAERYPAILRTIALSHDGIEIRALATQLNVSVKTIGRDLNALRELGVPLQERVTTHGTKFYWVSKDAIKRIHFRYDEALALMLCQPAAKVLNGTPLGEAAASGFEKLRIAFGSRETKYVDRMLSRIHRTYIGSNYSLHGEVFDALQLAIEESRATFISYRSSRSTEPVTYDIHPYGMLEHRGSWYVVGYSCEHGGIRTWKLDRMDDADVTKIQFERPADFDINNYQKGALAVVTGNEVFSIRIRIARSAARYVAEKRFHDSQHLESQSDGTAVVTFELSSLIEIKSWVLSFGAAAEVLEPESLRKEVRWELRNAANMYQKQRSTP
jgi:proteasome accessory factor B